MFKKILENITRRNYIILNGIILIFLTGVAAGQADRKLIREGNRDYGRDKYPDSEVSYRKALDKNKESSDAVFNTGDALYKQKKYEEAGRQFAESHSMVENNKKKSSSLYNLGNSFLMTNKLDESIQAYKGSLKLDPGNMEAKYNLAYAQDLLKQQQEQNNKDQNKKDQDKQDQQKDQKKDKQDQQKDQNKDKQDQNKDQQQEQQQQISKEDAERLLNALANDEKNVQEKVKLAKAQKERVRSVKNW